MKPESEKATIVAESLRARFSNYVSGLVETGKERLGAALLGERLIVGDDPKVPIDEYIL